MGWMGGSSAFRGRERDSVGRVLLMMAAFVESISDVRSEVVFGKALELERYARGEMLFRSARRLLAGRGLEMKVCLFEAGLIELIVGDIHLEYFLVMLVGNVRHVLDLSRFVDGQMVSDGWPERSVHHKHLLEIVG